MSFLSVNQLEKSYDKQTIFAGINFQADKGELVTLLGPSGCGKSTLLRCIAGLTEISGGKIVLNQKEITHMPPQKRNIAMVFQNYALFPNMTAFENIAFGLKMRQLDKKIIHQKVTHMLELVELTDFAQRYPHQLSGGQCQRVALARALVVEPDLLLLDEPLSALDAKIRKHLREQIRHIQQQLKLTTIFVTHDQEEALSLSDRIVLMDKGEIVQNTKAIELYLAPKNQFVAGFIGHYNILTQEQANRLFAETITTSLAIRPEIISLSRLPQAINGTVISRHILGNIVRYRVNCHDILLVVDCLNISEADYFHEGERVGVSIPLSLVQSLA
ncbi:spermidine/putrescine ABC transporter ATP-binding protein [Pelistega indica]|uniref:Spermidine/putrescine ABC transporter ATP-binding protein n=1 Tax=Pelistega indica TaxID=1414851 RepID=V8G935_9BURK|nr:MULTISPECIES: ABC transporter ATP-binding protein [Pelistega]ETD73024.1 spermidine/putrescine ABC transporter ATP-binding protein [Pelistega indica]